MFTAGHWVNLTSRANRNMVCDCGTRLKLHSGYSCWLHVDCRAAVSLCIVLLTVWQLDFGISVTDEVGEMSFTSG